MSAPITAAVRTSCLKLTLGLLFVVCHLWPLALLVLVLAYGPPFVRAPFSISDDEK